ncbi:MAG: amidohydrolase [Clostridiaceae bacterium]|nr:amidohydrolase [Clostridiaceae bacterium]
MTNEQVFSMVERHRSAILDAERDIWKHPETGYREWYAHRYMAERFEKLGYTLTCAGDIPGFYTDLDTGLPGPKVLILGELDSLLCATHPDANPETGAVHACGHHAQLAALLGIAAALKEPGALDGLSGSVRLCAVPAEELIEVGWREELRKQGVIRYYGGKVEFLARGYFDGVDLAVMIHTGGKSNTFGYNRGCNGCVVKNITYEGVASHAGGSPENGVNGLYAANLGMTAANALRETFRDSEHIRFHPIITAGGAAVNAIPDTVKLESYVRGASTEAIVRENRKINRALAASAAAMGANVTLCDRPGYTPLANDPTLLEVAHRAMAAVVGEDNVWRGEWSTGCTDMGDLSAVMPAIHPYAGGSAGTGHGADYRIEDPVSACVNSAKCQALLLRMLLENDAAEAKRVCGNSKPRFASREDYFAMMDSLVMDKRAVTTNEDGTITLDFTK